MNENIIAKLHTALYHISPLASEREKLIASLGEVIWLESLEELLLALPEDKRTTAVEALNAGNLLLAIEICEKEQIQIETIIEKVADRVMREEVE